MVENSAIVLESPQHNWHCRCSSSTKSQIFVFLPQGCRSAFIATRVQLIQAIVTSSAEQMKLKVNVRTCPQMSIIGNVDGNGYIISTKC